MLSTGEEQMGKFATQLLSNEKFMTALGRAMSGAREVKDTIERGVQASLGAMNIPSSADVRKLSDKVEELERIFEGLSKKIDGLRTNNKS